jgi:hypothetical protein
MKSVENSRKSIYSNKKEKTINKTKIGFAQKKAGKELSDLI